jgi:hypothetical protein
LGLGLQAVDQGIKSEIKHPKSEVKISRRSSGVEHFLGKEEVMGSNPIVGSIILYYNNLEIINLQTFINHGKRKV